MQAGRKAGKLEGRQAVRKKEGKEGKKGRREGKKQDLEVRRKEKEKKVR